MDVQCFDCNKFGNERGMMQVWRHSNGTPIDWHKAGGGALDHANVFYVHRTNTGCNKGRTASEIRTGAK